MIKANRQELPWIAGCALLIGLGIWWLPNLSGTSSDSFSHSGSGKSAFYELTERLHRYTDRNSEPLRQALYADVVLILGPARYPDRGEWNELYEWVESGGQLLFAVSRITPAVEIPRFGIELTTSRRGDSDDTRTPQAEGDARQPDVAGIFDVDYEWEVVAEFDDLRTEAEVLMSVDGEPQVIRERIGFGSIVVAASDQVFTNRALADREQKAGVLATQILNSLVLEDAWILFDESLNASGVPRGITVLFDPAIRRTTLQILLIVVLLLWSASRSFGAPQQSPHLQRRSVREHAVALGHLHLRRGANLDALESFVEFFRQQVAELGLWSRTRGELRTLLTDSSFHTCLSNRSQVEFKVVQKLFSDVAEALASHRISSSEATRLIRSIAKIRDKL